MSNNWWCDESGRNHLKGVEGEEGNPPILPEWKIVHFLLRIPKAKADFERMLPSLSETEQARLADIIERNPAAITHIIKDEADVKHKFTNKVNGTIRTVGPKGGGYP